MNNIVLSPETDNCLFKNYSKSSLKAKSFNKTALQKEHDLLEGKDMFVIGITFNITEENKGNELIELLKAALEIQMQILICAQIDEKYRKIMELFKKEYPHMFQVLEPSEENKRKVFAAADAQIFLTMNDGVETELQMSRIYGVVPVSVEHETLKNFDPVNETGNAFLIQKTDFWHIFEACIRARENFKFPYDWKNLQMECMSS